MFPFYRTDIIQFEQTLNSIKNVHTGNQVYAKFFKVDEIKKVFCVTTAWNELWPNVDILLRSFMFKELVMTCTLDGLNYRFLEHEWSNHISKLDIAILGLLWCTGTHQQKVKYLTKLVNPTNSTWITS